MKQGTVVFGNLICKFGDRYNLIDFVPEIIFPAFSNTRYRRKYLETEFFMHDVTLQNLGSPDDPDLAIIGRFIKKTKLTRTQIFIPDVGIRSDKDSIDSAPSALFVLLIKNHRVIYFADSRDAPDIKAFGATCRSIIRQSHNDYVRALWQERKTLDGRTTLSAIKIEIPEPEINVVSLTSSSDIDAFIDRYNILKVLKFRLLRPNDEADAGKLFEDIRKNGKKINATQSDLQYQNSSGLDKKQAAEDVKAATASGNQITYLSGTDGHNNTVRGNNESFQLSVQLPTIPPERAPLVTTLVRQFNSLVAAGSIILGVPSRDPRPKLRDIATRMLP